MDNIPNDGIERWIILNHYFHLTTSHTSVFEHKMRSLKGAVVRLLKRNTKVRVILQGPHIAWKGWSVHYAASDSLGQFIMDIQREIFRDVQDKVYYAYVWDMSVARGNVDYHPDSKPITAMINGYLCDS